MRVEWSGTDELAKKLREKSEIRWEGVVKKQLTDMFNRAKGNNPELGGTPVDTGELRISAQVDFRGGKSVGLERSGEGVAEVSGNAGNTSATFSGEMGYTKEYAPHVEYGHRTKGGGFIPGQHFLQNNVDVQRPIFKQDLIENLRKA